MSDFYAWLLAPGIEGYPRWISLSGLATGIALGIYLNRDFIRKRVINHER